MQSSKYDLMKPITTKGKSSGDSGVTMSQLFPRVLHIRKNHIHIWGYTNSKVNSFGCKYIQYLTKSIGVSLLILSCWCQQYMIKKRIWNLKINFGIILLKKVYYCSKFILNCWLKTELFFVNTKNKFTKRILRCLNPYIYTPFGVNCNCF